MASDTSIHELLSGAGDGDAEAEPARRRGRPRVTRVFSLLFFGAAWATPIYLLLRMRELTTPYLALYAGGLVLVLVWRLARGLRPPPRSRHAGRSEVDDQPHYPDGLLLASGRWDTMLDWCHTDVARFNRRVLPRLAELVDERLRQQHGITRASDPEAARRVLGDPLWTFVTMPARRSPGPRELDRVLTDLEKL